MNRAEFQALAELRLTEAEALLTAGLWDGAYYLAGYAVECGLKACIAKLTRAEDFPPKPEIVRDYYSHDLLKLLKASGLADEHAIAVSSDGVFASNWTLVTKWTEQTRYRTAQPNSEGLAKELLAAITDPMAGVLPWIKQQW